MQATFPFRLLRQEAQFWLEGQSLEAQQSISGAETVTPTMRGRWMASCNFVLHGEAATLEWQAFLAQMEGRVGTALVPAISRWRPRDRAGHPVASCETGELAGAQTWEHFGFANSDPARVTVAAAAPLRATQIDVTLQDSTGLRPGQYFSIGERLHRVQSHWQTSGATYRLMIQPPLRAAVAAGTRIEVDRPVCRMRMTTETDGVFDQSLAVVPTMTVDFSEAI